MLNDVRLPAVKGTVGAKDSVKTDPWYLYHDTLMGLRLITAAFVVDSIDDMQNLLTLRKSSGTHTIGA